MKDQTTLRRDLESGALDARLTALCGCTGAALAEKRGRLFRLLEAYGAAFGTGGAAGLFSGPGRTEMGGNHTDHQHGCVLAAAIDLDALACAGPNGSNTVRILSAGYPDIAVDLSGRAPVEAEKETSAALVRGIAARFAELGYPVGGFNACVDSTVLGGSGLSSSAAYEVLIGIIINHLFCGDEVTLVQIAQIGQYAENVYFGKPCGLMDQLASAVGGIVSIDFQNPDEPAVHKLDYDLSGSGYALCIIDSGADHADLTAEYAAIPAEMGAAARCFGKEVLRDVDYHEFWDGIPKVRAAAGDRAVLRAVHFFIDNYYAQKEAQALEKDNFTGFLTMADKSGRSSSTLLQNLYCTAQPQAQAVNIALTAAQHLLAGDGAARVHGGGFAGTVQAYVPNGRIDAFRAGMEAILGEGCCHFLRIRPEGGAVIV
ncbi:MAG: galactokinase family protein [Eubacteriales bacterium]|nr:galactokinase family protein [Eubacteriales bacterium]